MIVKQDPMTGYWNRVEVRLTTHAPEECKGRLCDIHNRRSPAEGKYPLNWREDRGFMEFICDCGIGHPTAAQVQYWTAVLDPEEALAQGVHGCCGCCAGVEGARE